MPSKPSSVPARERILQVATRLFIRHGFGGTPVSKIVRESGVTMPVLYYHFGSKVGLLGAVIEARAQWLQTDHNIDPCQGFDRVCSQLINTALAHVEDLRDGLRLRVMLSFETGSAVATLRSLTEQQRGRSLCSLKELFQATLPEASDRRCSWLSEIYLSGVQALALELIGFTGNPNLLEAKGDLLRLNLAHAAGQAETELPAGLS